MLKRYKYHVLLSMSFVCVFAVHRFFGIAETSATIAQPERSYMVALPAESNERLSFLEKILQMENTVDLDAWTEIALFGLKDENPAVRRHAVRMLHRYDDTREDDVVTALGGRLRDTAEKRCVKFEVLMALGNLGSPGIMAYRSELESAFMEDGSEEGKSQFPASDRNYRTEAAKVLLGVGGVKDALPLFERAQDPAAKFAALQALYAIGSVTHRQFGTDQAGVARVLAYVLKHVDDEDVDVRKVAVQSLQYVWLRESSDAAEEDLETNVQIRQLLEARLAKETDKILAEMIQGILSPSSLTPTPTAGTLEPHARSAASSRCIPCGK